MTKEQEEKIVKIVKNMSDEEIEDRIRQDEQGEEEAIEYIKKRIKVCNENADICDDNNFNEEATYLREESYMLETVLSMLKEKDKDKEIEKKDKIIDRMAEFIFQNIDVEEDVCNSAYVECTQETAQDITCINCIKQYFIKGRYKDGFI